MQVSQHRNERTADSASALACEQRLCSLVDYAAVAIAFVDLRGRLAHVNSSFADLLGYQADELLGRSFKDFLHPADRSRIVRLFLKVGLLRRQPRMMEFRALHKDGHTLHLMSRPTRAIQNGKTIGFQAILTDITERKKTEEKLKKKEERHRLMFENMTNAVAIYEAVDDGRDFIIKDFNLAAERIEKIKKKDVIGKRVTEVFPGVEEFGLLGIFQRVWKTGRPEHYPAKVYKDKRIVGWRANRVYKLPSGEVVAIYEDVTERKQTQDEAEKYRQFLEMIIDNSPDPIYIKTTDSTHVLVNTAHSNLLGKSKGEIQGRTDYELYSKEQADDFRKTDKEVIGKGSIIDVPELRITDVNGFDHILHTKKAPLKDDKGNVTHIIGVTRDITESKKMEGSLRESEEKYRAIVENSPSLILILQEGGVKFVNEVACKRSGWTFEELTSPSFNFTEKAVAKEFQGLVKDNIMKRLRGETIPSYEINLLSRDGSEFPVLVRAQRILYRGQPADLVILTDITELKKAEEELAEHSEFLDNVLSSMSDYVYVLDEAYTIRFINETAKKKYGFKPGDKCFKAIRNRDSPCHHSGIPCEIQEILEKGKDHFEDTRPDTNGILTHMLARPITVDGRKAVILVFRDLTELKRSEEELKRSLSILHTTLESTADGILVVSQDGKIANYNQRFVMMFHISDQIMKSQDDRQLIEIIQKQVKDPEAYYNRTRELYAHPELERFDLLEFKDDRVFERYSRPQQLGGEVIGRVISFRDVTERKRSEEALRSSEEFSSGLLENSLTPILVVNADTSIRYVNPALEKLTAYSSSELVGTKTPFPWWSKELIKETSMRLEENMRRGLTHYEEHLKRKNGEDFWVEINAGSTKENGLIKHYLSSWVDITERKKMEEELKRYSEHLEELVKEKSRDLVDSEERYHRLIEESPQAIHVHCEDKFVYVNSAAVRLFGAERPEQLIGKPVTDVVHSDYRERVKERIRRTKEEKAAAPYLEMKFLRLDGTEVDVAAVAIPITYQGKPAIQVITLDIADRKRMEKAKDNFMSAVTHELRTPLTSLKGYLELVMNELGPLPGQIKSDLEVVERNTNRLLSLTNDLLDIQRMSSGKLQLNLEQLDLREVIAEAATEISPLVQARKQSLNIEAPHHPLLINGDRIRLSQVLMNLLSNATKFAPEGGKIHINVRDDDALVTIEVSDPGIGIKEEDLEKVFEPFAVISKPTYIKGTGLGLSIVKGLVEAHGGKTWGESPGEGRGATFTCTLPKRR